MVNWKALAHQWQDGLCLVLGLWLLASPWTLGYAGDTVPAWNAHLMGAVILIAAASIMAEFQRWEELLNAAVGVWLVISPWLLGFSAFAAARANQVVIGIAVAALATWSANANHERGRGLT